jgi:hypothetical protein
VLAVERSLSLLQDNYNIWGVERQNEGKEEGRRREKKRI